MEPKSWSLSTLSLYAQCAFKYKCVKVDKLPEKPSYHLMKGIEAHAIAEQFLLGRIPNIPPVLAKFKREFINLKAKGALAEEAITLDSNWKVIPDGWSHNDAWLRMKIDARIDNYIVDFKTGKHYNEHVDQARLYSNALMMNNTGMNEVDVEFWYLNSGEVTGYTFARDTLDLDITDWNIKVEKFMADNDYLPTKNQYCRYCDFMMICPLYKDNYTNAINLK